MSLHRAFTCLDSWLVGSCFECITHWLATSASVKTNPVHSAAVSSVACSATEGKNFCPNHSAFDHAKEQTITSTNTSLLGSPGLPKCICLFLNIALAPFVFILSVQLHLSVKTFLFISFLSLSFYLCIYFWPVLHLSFLHLTLNLLNYI